MEKEIEDYRVVTGFIGEPIHDFNEQANELIKKGYVPFDKLQISYTPKYTIPGSYSTGGGIQMLTQAFVKYKAQ